METYKYTTKIHKTIDKKHLASGKDQKYEYGTINLRKPELAKHIGRNAKITIKILKS
jgi:hypothetical protein